MTNSIKDQSTKSDQLSTNIFNHLKDTLHFCIKERRKRFLKENKKLIDSIDDGELHPDLVIYIKTLEHAEELLSFLINILTHKIIEQDINWEREQEEMK